MTKNAYSCKQLAELLGISERHVHRLTDDGILTAAGGRYDPMAACRAYLKHIRHDHEGRAARAGLARQETLRKRVQTAQMSAEVMTLTELAALADEFLAGAKEIESLAAADFFYGVRSIATERTELEIRGLIGTIAQATQARYYELRGRWKQRLAGAKVELADPDRVERVLAELAAEHGDA